MAGNADTFPFDVFISRRGSVAAVAQEVADILAADGLTARLQDYDFASGNHVVLDIHQALQQARDLLILHTADYDASFWTQPEFANFFPAVAQGGGKRRIGLLRCDAAEPDGLFQGITRGDLHGVTDPAERRRIILQVARGETPRARPTPRIFGGTCPPPTGCSPVARTNCRRRTRPCRPIAASRRSPRRPCTASAAWEKPRWPAPISTASSTPMRHLVDHRHRPCRHPDRPRRPRPRPGPRPAGRYENVEDAAALALQRIVARRGASFLLVYDNLPSPETLRGLVPVAGARVLITSRWRRWSEHATDVNVPVLPEHEAVALLLRAAGAANRSDAWGALALARLLGCLPLALAHAAAYVATCATSFDSYASRLDTLLKQAPEGAAYPDSVFATFFIALDAAMQRSPASGHAHQREQPRALPLGEG